MPGRLEDRMADLCAAVPGRRALAGLAAALLLAATATAEPATPDPALSGQDVYARVLSNRFDTFTQESHLASGDEAGRTQETHLRMHFMDFRDAEDQPRRGVLSKTLVQYTHPFDLRHAGYLVIQNHQRENDQFVYLPARRQTVRVNLRGEAVFGTDFSFEDVIPRELEDATYTRLPDAPVAGLPTYVVEARPVDHYDSEYSKFLFYVDAERYVPLRTRYWDEAGVEVKEMRTTRGDVERFGEIFIPTKLTMRHLLHESFTTLEITNLVPNPALPESAFEVRRLESH
jgi:hypothetical protein